MPRIKSFDELLREELEKERQNLSLIESKKDLVNNLEWLSGRIRSIRNSYGRCFEDYYLHLIGIEIPNPDFHSLRKRDVELYSVYLLHMETIEKSKRENVECFIEGEELEILTNTVRSYLEENPVAKRITELAPTIRKLDDLYVIKIKQ